MLASPVTTAKQATAKRKSFERYPKNKLDVFNQFEKKTLLEHYGPAALDRVTTVRGLPPRLSSEQDYIFLMPHRESAQKARERICKLTKSSKKARMKLGEEESASSRASNNGTDTDPRDKTVVLTPWITLKGPSATTGTRQHFNHCTGGDRFSSSLRLRCGAASD